MASFVEKRLPGELSVCAEILAAATVDEPRNVKRLANSLLINHELAGEASFENYDPRILTMVVLIQNQAPDLYRQLPVRSVAHHRSVQVAESSRLVR